MSPELPEGPFDLIYADPAWPYRDSGNPRGGVDNHYETMSIEEICNLDVPVADDAILYLWTTAPHAQNAFDVLEAWGFEYKSQAVWDKMKIGSGYWMRGQHELLYIGVRGDVSPPDPDIRRSSVFREERGKHSKKPRKVRGYIEQAHPETRKLELFSRDGRVGWTMWGNETVDNPQSTFANL